MKAAGAMSDSPTPPAHVKQQIVLGYGREYSLPILVETGTRTGDMIAACWQCFERCYSIELDSRLHEHARRRFEGNRRIYILPGDSAQMLPYVFSKVDRPCLFWLDAHQMEGGVRGEKITPIREELRLILENDPERSVVLIDDARLFREGSAYPVLDTLRQWVLERQPGASFSVKNDVIRIVGPAAAARREEGAHRDRGSSSPEQGSVGT